MLDIIDLEIIDVVSQEFRLKRNGLLIGGRGARLKDRGRLHSVDEVRVAMGDAFALLTKEE